MTGLLKIKEVSSRYQAGMMLLPEPSGIKMAI